MDFVLDFEFSRFGLVSDFRFRISDLPNPSQESRTPDLSMNAGIMELKVGFDGRVLGIVIVVVVRVAAFVVVVAVGRLLIDSVDEGAENGCIDGGKVGFRLPGERTPVLFDADDQGDRVDQLGEDGGVVNREDRRAIEEDVVVVGFRPVQDVVLLHPF